MTPRPHHVEEFFEDGKPWRWGWQCFTCCVEETGLSRPEAERRAHLHEVASSVPEAYR